MRFWGYGLESGRAFWAIREGSFEVVAHGVSYGRNITVP
jgi:hypothetical protein